MLRKRFCILLTALLLITALSPMLVSADAGDTVWEEWEPNDFIEEAILVYSDETFVGTLGIYDLDRYVFELPYKATITLLCLSDADYMMMGVSDSNDEMLGAAVAEPSADGYYYSLYGELPAGLYFITLLNSDPNLTSAYALYFCYSPADTPTIHKHSFVSTYVAPTCLSYGYTLHDCSTCDYSYKDNYGDKKGAHVFSDSDNCDVCGVSRTGAPIVIAYDYSSVILQEVEGCEYSMNGVSFQKSPIFTGLSPATTYYFCQRIAAKDGLPAGEISPSVKVVTSKQPSATPSTPTGGTTTDINGDLNGDQKVNISDAVLLYYHVNGKTSLNDENGADMNLDGKINISDAVKLYYYVNGKIDTL